MREGARAHWEGIYAAKSDRELSWTQIDVRTSLSLISRFAPPKCRTIDVGGGSSLLAGRLIDKGYSVAVLDISGAALARAAEAMGERSGEVRWVEADVTRILWHDRAVFHFLTEAADRAAYRALMARTIPAGGHAVIATFTPAGPDRCSGLDVQRYDSASLAVEVGKGFQLVHSVPELHLTPSGAPQPFQYSVFRRNNSD